MSFVDRIKRLLFTTTPHDVIIQNQERTGFTLKQLKSNQRGKKIAAARKSLIRGLDCYTKLTVKEIAEILNVSTQYVYHVLNH